MSVIELLEARVAALYNQMEDLQCEKEDTEELLEYYYEVLGTRG
jgi:hypothetical protein